MKTYLRRTNGTLYVVHPDGRSTTIPAPLAGQEPHWLYTTALEEVERGEAEIIDE